MKNKEDILLLFNEGFFRDQGVISVGSESDIPDSDAILFIGSHRHTFNLKHLNPYLKAIKSKPFTYSIICGKTDGCLSEDIEMPKNVKKFYCNNVDYSHDVIKFLPMGRDFRSRDCFSQNFNKKDIFIFIKFFQILLDISECLYAIF